jgi:hypothetical protein
MKLRQVLVIGRIFTNIAAGALAKAITDRSQFIVKSQELFKTHVEGQHSKLNSRFGAFIVEIFSPNNQKYYNVLNDKFILNDYKIDALKEKDIADNVVQLKVE